MKRTALALAMLAVGATLIGTALARGEADTTNVRDGGTFRIAQTHSDSIDPALGGAWFGPLLDAACARLMNYPDKAPPARLVPEVAAGYPRVSPDGKTYTFTIRRRVRFSDGKALTVQSFAQAFRRVLAPSMESAAFLLEDVVGAQDVREGSLPAGIVAKGRRLTIRLTKPVPDLPARLATTAFCAVPPNLPINPEGVGAPLHSAGPYYFAEYVPGRRVVLKRNRFYHGKRPRHVAKIVVDLSVAGPQEAIERVKKGTADWSDEQPRSFYFDQAKELRRRGQLFVRPDGSFTGFFFNSRRPLFRNNARLRRAVNFAVDRPAHVRQYAGPLSGRPTDQYLPPSMPGFRDARIYPLAGPNLKKARALAKGHLRSGKAVLYVRDSPIHRGWAQMMAASLAKIGLDVDLKVWPRDVFFRKVFDTPGEPWDIAQFGWIPDFADPFTYLNGLFASASGSNPGFRSPKYDRLLARAARLNGGARYRAYGTLDVRLARDAAPMVSVFLLNAPTFVSKRVDPRCVVLRPLLDLAAVCLKR